MKYKIIATGSRGNAVVLEDFILLDCGVPYKKLEPYVKDLRLVLLSHVHSDHFNPSTIRRLHQERPLLRFGCCEWLVGPLQWAGVHPENIDVYTLGGMYYYENNNQPVSARPFGLVHDVENCGYKVQVGSRWAIYATDTATMDGIEAPRFDLYMIEANYTEAELEERIRRKTESGEFVYEYRAAASHLSRGKADEWLRANAGPNSEIVYLHGHIEDREEQKTC